MPVKTVSQEIQSNEDFVTLIFSVIISEIIIARLLKFK